MPINYFGNTMIYLEENSKEKSCNSKKMVLFRGMFTNSYESANFLGDIIVQLV